MLDGGAVGYGRGYVDPRVKAKQWRILRIDGVTVWKG